MAWTRGLRAWVVLGSDDGGELASRRARAFEPVDDVFGMQRNRRVVVEDLMALSGSADGLEDVGKRFGQIKDVDVFEIEFDSFGFFV